MATLREVAQVAGVSVSTASKALNGQMKENRPTSIQRAAHIRQVASRLNYRPNGAARAVTRGTLNCVAILQDDGVGRSKLPPPLLDGIHDALATYGKHAAYARVPDCLAGDEDGLPTLMREFYADGFLVNINTWVPEAMKDLVRKQNLPVVWINSTQEMDCVRPDDFGAGKAVTQELIRQGHQRIGYADFVYHTSTRHYSRDERFAGYLTAMEEADLEPICVANRTSHASPVPVIDVAERCRLVQAYGELTGLVTYQLVDIMELMLGGYDRLRKVDFATFCGAGEHVLPIVTAVVPEYEVGHQAAALLCEKLSNPEIHSMPVLVPFTIRGTNGVPVETHK